MEKILMPKRSLFSAALQLLTAAVLQFPVCFECGYQKFFGCFMEFMQRSSICKGKIKIMCMATSH
jgi:hypothetical protein